MEYQFDADWLKEFKRLVLKAAGAKTVAALWRKLPKAAGIEYQTVARYFRGEREIPLHFIVLLQRLTEKSYDALLPGVPTKEVDVDEIKRQGVKEFLAENVGRLASGSPVTQVASKKRR